MKLSDEEIQEAYDEFCPSKIAVHNAEEILGDDGYPVLRVTYSTDDDDDLTEDLPMVEIPPDEDMPGYWDVNTKRLTAFQSKLFDAVCDDAAHHEQERRERGY